jgi:succinate dehydrogenase/fumarate reductase flavoprotein subunit
MRLRFPTIASQLNELNFDLATDLIPVAPAAHYFMGGIVASTAGETTLPGLLAIGEAACTGFTGPTAWRATPSWRASSSAAKPRRAPSSGPPRRSTGHPS